MTTPPLNCLALSDGRRGIENQALGLVEAASAFRDLKITTQHIENDGLFKAAAPGMQFALKSKPADYGLGAMIPDIAIGCGRQAIAPLRALKKAHGSKVFTVYIQAPRTDLSYFDLVIAPEHDGLTGRNVETMIGSPNRVSEIRIVGETLSFAEQLSKLPMPRIAALIGGPSKTHKLSKNTHGEHITALRGLIEGGYSLMITTSRRTPDWALADYKLLESDFDNVWLYSSGDVNPYFAFLGGSEAILVTEESTNMLTEACASGKPVFRLPMEGDAGKFQNLYDALRTRCGVKRFSGSVKAPDYEPLNETTRIAERLWAHFDARGAVIN